MTRSYVRAIQDYVLAYGDILSDPDFEVAEFAALAEFCRREPDAPPTLAELGFDRSTGTLRGRRLA
ncbi:hypothetical protein ACQPW3_36145 [Actinosynnema sp. CA-248983]